MHRAREEVGTGRTNTQGLNERKEERKASNFQDIFIRIPVADNRSLTDFFFFPRDTRLNCIDSVGHSAGCRLVEGAHLNKKVTVARAVICLSFC